MKLRNSPDVYEAIARLFKQACERHPETSPARNKNREKAYEHIMWFCRGCPENTPGKCWPTIGALDVFDVIRDVTTMCILTGIPQEEFVPGVLLVFNFNLEGQP